MKQTAVEWLREKLWKEYGFEFSNNTLEQAKEMEKEQLESLKDFDVWKEWKNKSE